MRKHKEQKQEKKIDEIALVLIVVIIILIVGFYTRKEAAKESMGAEKISEMILDHHLGSFANNGIIDDAKLKQIEGMNYAEFKKYLNVDNDFCVYIEDSQGNLILAKGSEKLNKDGAYCKE